MDWFWKLTGGRPMTIGDSLFVDRVSGETVYAWRDKFGREWMATMPLLGVVFFRVRRGQ